MNRLTIHNGPKQGRRFSLKDPEIQVGSGEQAGIRIDDSDVAGIHLGLLCSSDDTVQLTPAGKDCLTLVNGNAVEGTVQLQHGDEVQIGSTRLGFTNVALHSGMAVRRVGKMHRITVVSIIFVLIVEALFILGFSLFRQDKSSLEALRDAELAARKETGGKGEEDAASSVPKAPQLSIAGAGHIFAKDNQDLFDICLIDIEFRAQRTLSVEEQARIRVAGQFLEKVGTNGWTHPVAFLPSPAWTVHPEDGNQEVFVSNAAILIPRALAGDVGEEAPVTQPVILGGTLRVFYDDELQDEKNIKIQLLERMNRTPPEV